MNSPWISLLALVVFILAMILGLATRHRLHERYISQDTTGVLHTTVSMLITFAAIVVGLLMNSSKADFSAADAVMHNYAASLVSLDDALRGVGQPGVPIQKSLAAYTAAMIASTWPNQAPPPGDYYPKNLVGNVNGQLQENHTLTDLLNTVGNQVNDLPADTSAQRQDRAHCVALVERVTEQRWNLITASQVSLSAPFFVVLVFWISTAFLCLGLSAPANRLSIVVMTLSAAALASALFVIVDLNTLYDNGFFAISSAPVDGALAHMPHG